MRAILEAHPIIPVVTFNTIEEVEPLVDHLLAQDIRCIEITLRTPVAMDCIQHLLNKRSHEITIGVGTVIHPEQLQHLDQMGVAFIVSPGLSPALSNAFKSYKVPFIPGVATPSEIISALSQGFNTLKFFPANLFGGLASLKTYGQVFPEVRFCPTGGISGNNYREFLALENVISVGGSWVVK